MISKPSEIKPAKRSRFDMKQPIMNTVAANSVAVEPTPPPATVQLSSAEIQSMMANVRKQIEEKKRQQQQKAMPASMAVPLVPSLGSSIPVDGKSRIAQLEAQIKASLASRPNLSTLTAQK